MARHVAESLDDSGRLALVMPRDNSTVATEFEALLRYDAPRHPFLDVFSPMTSEPVIPATVAAQGYHQAFVSCTTGMGMGLPPDAGALFTWSDGVWTPTQVWPYPPAPKRTWWNWTSFIASEPLCL